MSADNPDPKAPRAAAVLVAVQLPGIDDVDHAADLQELGRLVHTLGYDVVATVSQRRHALSPSAVLGQGKLRELGALTGGTGIVPTFTREKKSKAREKADAAAGLDDDEDGDFTGDDFGGDDGDSGAPRDDAHDDGEPRAPHGGRLATVVVVDHEITPSQARNLEKATGAEVLDRTGVIVEIFHRHAKSREAKLQVEIARLNYVAPRMRETGGGADRQRGGVGGKGAGESAIELD
ncbi:MAG: GTPase HflX, partial [Polyangiales bacterium]